MRTRIIPMHTTTTAQGPARTLDWRLAVKYAIDRMVAVLAIVVLTPLLLMLALAVRLGSRGPILFRQRRVGLNGQIFEVFKFRTMAERPGAQGPDEDSGAQEPAENDGAQDFVPPEGVAPGGVEGKDRRTGLGRVLRATSLDELPQLFNVLRGDMSLVGPRPERPGFVRQFATEVPGYADRHRVKCGITGWAQANGLRGQTSIAERAAFDNYYIDNWSLGLELKTLAMTVVEVLRFRDRQTPATSASIADRVAVHSSRRTATAVPSIESAAA
jgi:lipopolysaccharide/colanic/teichoic acid biosynthesis glycosyltransferase